MKTIRIPNGFISINESKAACQNCGHKFDIEFLEKRWFRKKNRKWMEPLCECGKRVGIAVNMLGDYVSFSLDRNQPKLLKYKP